MGESVLVGEGTQWSKAAQLTLKYNLKQPTSYVTDPNDSSQLHPPVVSGKESLHRAIFFIPRILRAHANCSVGHCCQLRTSCEPCRAVADEPRVGGYRRTSPKPPIPAIPPASPSPSQRPHRNEAVAASHWLTGSVAGHPRLSVCSHLGPGTPSSLTVPPNTYWSRWREPRFPSFWGLSRCMAGPSSQLASREGMKMPY